MTVRIMRIIVCGSRTWSDPTLIERAMRNVSGGDLASVTWVHGHCRRGADRICDRLAPGCERHEADWDTHGKSAGHVRNVRMANLGADLCLAFDRHSPGTADMIRVARLNRIRVLRVLADGSSTLYLPEGFSHFCPQDFVRACKWSIKKELELSYA